MTTQSPATPAAIAARRREVALAIGRPVRLNALASTPTEAVAGLDGLAAHLQVHTDPPAAIVFDDLGAFTIDAPEPDRPAFIGEVALISGGASGIGKAIVASLLERGTAVVNLDLNPAVTTLFDAPLHLGIQVDVTDEAALVGAFDQATRRFGGLDMLVLNAGIFPPGVRIEDLATQAWDRVLRINLDPNLVLLREAHALLKLAPRYGRVVVNASKNVLAPGAGAVAYSSAKAAVTQMARVAALEWAKEGIRVNVVHPDQVFDTGIWTEEVLNARAAHYGLTVEQYKRRNLLGVEIKSRYVGEFVAEMLGPMFENITGVQIPIDGGSDRII
ncbi:MAG TPA: SDR family oxidoreductase [Anaerolineales bacterium]|nr:SDR family oxidoreductase [Anaerolineales bacterium]